MPGVRVGIERWRQRNQLVLAQLDASNKNAASIRAELKVGIF